jgi:hypothetical protein
MVKMLRAIGKFFKWWASQPRQSSPPINYSPQKPFWPEKSEFARVQVQDDSGMWRDTAATLEDPQVYLARMQEAAYNHPGKRVRTIDGNGRLLDLF